MNDKYYHNEDRLPSEREEVKDFILDLADYIAFNNRDFVCSTCLEVLEKLKEFMLDFYGWSGYTEISDMIESVMEEDENE